MLLPAPLSRFLSAGIKLIAVNNDNFRGVISDEQ